MKTFLVLFLLTVCSVGNAQQFIQQQVYQPPIVQSNVVYPVSVDQQPMIVYQWIPYTVPQTVTVEHHCLFRQTQTTVTQPVIRWVYQPVLIYR